MTHHHQWRYRTQDILYFNKQIYSLQTEVLFINILDRIVSF